MRTKRNEVGPDLVLADGVLFDLEIFLKLKYFKIFLHDFF